MTGSVIPAEAGIYKLDSRLLTSGMTEGCGRHLLMPIQDQGLETFPTMNKETIWKKNWQ